MNCNDGLIAWATCAQVLVTVGGFVFLWTQIRETKEAIQNDAHDSLYTHYMGVLSFMLERPHLYPYFYQQRPMPEPDAAVPHLRSELELVSEAMLGLIEHSVMYKNFIPGDAWRNCWHPFAHERLRASKVLQAFYDKNKCWYAKALRDALQQAPEGVEPIRGLETRVPGEAR